MVKNSINVQDQFLNQVRRERETVIIELLGGIQLEGIVKSFDNFSILFDSDRTYLIYKHAVSTISIVTP
ncbi:MAG: RNA chaperone Hfq [Deltaproteobacteria bacterium]|uniref:RNA-binding protein Hfq n=1 Tax=Candidatus Zymogenus saltonus TaxID=2844893 RepID=A0A9D8KI39_9DELT|nr:RNA chaperone Hfq [Candidatus Zymogenus saltonus]